MHHSARLIPQCQVRKIHDVDRNVDISPPEAWQAKEGEIASIFTEFHPRNLTNT
jgi:hypothetical protein